MTGERPKVGAGVVIIRDGMTLLARRQGSHASGMWGSMGGHVEFGETPVQACIREAREELGIEIGNLTFVSCTNILRDGKHYVDVSFTAELVAGEPAIREPHKILEIGWFPLDSLPSPLFDPVRVALEAFQTGQRYFEVVQ